MEFKKKYMRYTTLLLRFSFTSAFGYSPFSFFFFFLLLISKNPNYKIISQLFFSYVSEIVQKPRDEI
jgi:hypothetical protein